MGCGSIRYHSGCFRTIDVGLMSAFVQRLRVERADKKKCSHVRLWCILLFRSVTQTHLTLRSVAMPPEKSIRERDPEARYAPVDREGGADQSGQGSAEDKAQVDAAPLHQVSDFVHSHFGNTAVQAAMSGDQDPLSAIIGAEMSLGAAGVGGSGLTSNSQMSAMIGELESEEHEDVVVSRDARGSGIVDGVQAATLIERSRGQRLPGSVSARLSVALGTDISDARIHTDTAAQQAAEAVHAKAFAVGQDVFFAAGKYQPGTSEGDELLLHELTHVVQDAEGRIPTVTGGDGVQVSSTTDAHEREAEAVAAEAVGTLHGSGPDLDTAVESAQESAESTQSQSIGVAGDAMVSRDITVEQLESYRDDCAMLTLFTVIGGLSEDEAMGLLAGDEGPVDRASRSGPDLSSRDNNRAHPLDDEMIARPGHLSPENPGLTEEDDVFTMSLNEVFALHCENFIQEELGADVTHADVIAGIAMADSCGRHDVMDAIHAFKFRVEQYAWVETLNVEDSERYQRDSGGTYCNIYAYDLIRAMGAYIPRVFWYDAALKRINDGATVVTVEEWERLGAEARETHIAPVYAETVYEINTNTMTGWMDDHGSDFGWMKASSMTEAQDMANSGHPVFILAGSTRGSGHITVVLAEDGTHTALRDEDSGEVLQPLQSQAGANNRKYDSDSARGGTWWSDNRHVDGAAWIHVGGSTPPIPMPEKYTIE